MIDYYIPWLYNVSKSFKKTFNSKQWAKLKIETQRYRNKKKTKRKKDLVLPKE